MTFCNHLYLIRKLLNITEVQLQLKDIKVITDPEHRNVEAHRRSGDDLSAFLTSVLDRHEW